MLRDASLNRSVQRHPSRVANSNHFIKPHSLHAETKLDFLAPWSQEILKEHKVIKPTNFSRKNAICRLSVKITSITVDRVYLWGTASCSISKWWASKWEQVLSLLSTAAHKIGRAWVPPKGTRVLDTEGKSQLLFIVFCQTKLNIYWYFHHNIHAD